MVDVNDFDMEQVDSREDFISFVRDLVADFEQNGDEWKNGEISKYLKALAEWVLAAPNWAQNMYAAGRHPEMRDVDIPTWRIFAQALRVARTYE